jgi:hypothetical protein
LVRTTVTLDPDVEKMLQSAIRERGVSFKQALNEAIRAGLTRGRRPQPARFAQKSYHLGAAPDFRWDKALAMADAIEDEEITRKMALRK